MGDPATVERSPIFTEETECQDCYKCVRSCPVKAISVLGGRASVVREECVFCGTCVNTCPMGAKRVRDEEGKITALLESTRPVVVSLAPSWISEFPEWDEFTLSAAMRRLGFHGVSETALGAEIVSSRVAETIRRNPKGIYISTACPSALETAKKYVPGLIDTMTMVASPVMTHCRMLRRIHEQEIAVVFASPCIAKKLEADRNPDTLNIAITFEELREMMDASGITPDTCVPREGDGFIPRRSGDGVLYPVDGGMIESIKLRLADHDALGAEKPVFMSFSGMESILHALRDLEKHKPPGGVFLELLACEGGCINGPKTTHRNSPLTGIISVRGLAGERLTAGRHDASPEDAEVEQADSRIEPAELTPDSRPGRMENRRWSSSDIRMALEKVGKYTEADELNCGGCGYDSCREFALASLDGKAEATMCVSYMRKLALKKANALIKAMPSGVVIVGADMRVIECNRKFAELMGEEILLAYDAEPGMQGALLEKVVPFSGRFREVLEDIREVDEERHHAAGRILSVTFFPIEPGNTAGAVVRDITQPEVRREEIVRRVREVTDKNMRTVQQIAYLLGENAAENEIILKSIDDAFETERREETD